MKTDKSLKQIQREQAKWADHNFPDRKPYQPLLGLVEEVGELAHHHLKNEQGIRGTPEQHHAGKIDALADALIYMCDYATIQGIDLQEALNHTWDIVKERNWQKNPQTGGAGEAIQSNHE